MERETVTGLVLAGGRGTRMGGVDKGLQHLRGEPLVRHVMRRLAPQVDLLRVNANRNINCYQAFGAPLWPDVEPTSAGPLLGMFVGLQRCQTPLLAVVPCDMPCIPADLVERLAGALGPADVAVPTTRAHDGQVRLHPVSCLLRVSERLHRDLSHYMAAGHRQAEAWLRRHQLVEVPFADEMAFSNLNTLGDLQRLERSDA